MNKKILMALGAMAIAAVLGLIFSQNLSVSADPDLTYEDIREKVRAQYPGEITELELDNEGKKPIYEVEIEIDGKEYELLIDGNTGEVLKLDEKLTAKNVTKKEPLEVAEEDDAKEEDKSVEIKEKVEEERTPTETSQEEKVTVSAPKQEVNEKENETKATSQATDTQVNKAAETKQTEKPKAEKKQQQKPEKKQQQTKDKKSTISKEEAIQIALKQFSGKVEDVELDKDDGRLIYEIEIESSRGEAEIEIDAYTGKVLVVDIDLEDDDDDD